MNYYLVCTITSATSNIVMCIYHLEWVPRTCLCYLILNGFCCVKHVKNNDLFMSRFDSHSIEIHVTLQAQNLVMHDPPKSTDG